MLRQRGAIRGERWIAGVAALAVMLCACGDPAVDKAPTAVTDTTPERTIAPTVAATQPAPSATAAVTTQAPPPPTMLPSPAASPTIATPPTPARPTRTTLDFSTFPDWGNPSDPGTSATVSNGVLTIDAPTGFNQLESSKPYQQFPTDDPWLEDVSNARGWWVETRMRVDPLTDDYCALDNVRAPALTMWLTDDTSELVQIGFSPSALCLVVSMGEAVTVPMDTTSAFHTYRVSRQLRDVEVYVDGVLTIDHELLAPGETVQALIFGDGVSGGGPTRSYWDYFTYDVSGPSP